MSLFFPFFSEQTCVASSRALGLQHSRPVRNEGIQTARLEKPGVVMSPTEHLQNRGFLIVLVSFSAFAILGSLLILAPVLTFRQSRLPVLLGMKMLLTLSSFIFD